MFRFRQISFWLALLCGSCSWSFAADSGTLPPPVSRPVDFAREIQPIFAERCFGCHGPKKQEAEFRLDAKEVALKGGELGPAIVPGKSAESLLIKFVAGVDP